MNTDEPSRRTHADYSDLPHSPVEILMMAYIVALVGVIAWVSGAFVLYLAALAALGAGAALVVRSRDRRDRAAELAEDAAAVRAWWDAVEARHDSVSQEYADVLLDPDAETALPALFDSEDPRTRRFILAYTNALDVLHLHGDDEELTRAATDKYADAVGEAARAWYAALALAHARSCSADPGHDGDCPRRPGAVRGPWYGAGA